MSSRFCISSQAAAVLFALGALASVGQVAAQQPTLAQQSAIRSNCRSDFMANCSSVTPGGVEALQCLQRNIAKLSPSCQGAVNALNPQPTPQQAFPAAPPPAAAPSPATAAPPPAAAPPLAVAPARPPAKNIATPPAAPVQQRPAAPTAAPGQPTPQQQAAVKQHCRSDFMARCRGVQPGGAEALRCLQSNSAQLSPNCREAVAALSGGALPAPAAATGIATPAATPTPAQQSAVRFTCRRDFAIYCRGVTSGGPEAFACLQRNASRLSPDCKTSLAAIGEDVPTAPAAAGPKPVGPLRRIREKMMSQ